MSIGDISRYWSQFLDARMQTISESRRDHLTWHQAADLLERKLRSFEPPQHIWAYFQPILNGYLRDWRSAPPEELAFSARHNPRERPVLDSTPQLALENTPQTLSQPRQSHPSPQDESDSIPDLE